ncbi:site-specific integrase [Clostridia bacterium]|nr:site-specific integrase [Clostridia bacterium]
MNAASSNVLAFPSSQSVRPAPKKRKSGATRRKDGRYQKSLSYTLPDGKHMRKCFYGKTQAEAKEKKERFRRDIASGMDIQSLNITYKEYIERWLGIRKNRADKAIKEAIGVEDEPKAVKQYRNYAKLPLAIVGNKRLIDVGRSDMELCVSRLAGKSESYISKVSFVLNSIFECAQGDKILLFNPMVNVIFPQGTSGTHRMLEADEVSRARTKHTDHPMWLAVMIMLYAGLRRGEVIALHTDDIDLDNKVIHVRHAVRYETNQPIIGPPKTKASLRNIPISPILLDAIQRVKPNPGFIVGGGSTPVALEKFRRLWDSYIFAHEKEMNGLSTNRATNAQLAVWRSFGMRTHDLRHTFCTFLYDAGVDVKTAQLLMGHTDVKTTMSIYTHLSEQRKATSLDAFNRFFAV